MLKGKEAEKAARRILEAQGWDVHQAASQTVHRGPLVFSTSNDLWGCVDLACMHAVYGLWMVQVTTATGVTARRRKLEKKPWPFWMQGLRVSILESRDQRDPECPRRKLRYFWVHDLGTEGWSRHEQIAIPREQA